MNPPILTNTKRHVAIIGMGCRLPGGIETPNQLWDFLINKGNAISSCPEERWNQNIHFNSNPLNPSTHHVKEAGFLDDISSFDASFFGVSPREATCMDPQQRLLMEVTWRAIENAGIQIDEIKGTKTGVFIGISSCDYGMLLWGSEYDYLVPENETFLLSGNTGCIAANRLSYFLDLRGPSLTVDTACSSSLVAIDLAFQSINSGKCDMAIVGGVQIIVHPGIHTSFCKAGLLSASGQCKTFDNDADGYVRGEAAGVVILKSYEKALEDGDIIDAIICGSAVNSDGRSSGISAPRLDTQILCIESAYKDAELEASKTDYIEAHGTGTKQGDPIELEALGTALAIKTKCLVGSVKANLGHSETASGITGLIKAVLVAKNKEVPAAINMKTPNTKINLELYKLQIPLETTKIGEKGSPVQIGVSSFGFGGTNAHVVLVSAENNSNSKEIKNKTSKIVALILSARQLSTLQKVAGDVAKTLENIEEEARIKLIAEISSYRSNFRYRNGWIASSSNDLIEQLRAYANDNTENSKLMVSDISSKKCTKITFLITGQGSQWKQMGHDLYAQNQIFRNAVDYVMNYLDQETNELLLGNWLSDKGNESFTDTRVVQPALFVFGYALTELWKEWGVEPDAVIGHSVGEILAAYLDKVLTLKDAANIICVRAKLMANLPKTGGMIAIEAEIDDVRSLLECYPRTYLAGYNTVNQLVISGERSNLDSLKSEAISSGYKCNELNVSHAFHSPEMKPMINEFETLLKNIKFSSSSGKMYSTVSGKRITNETESIEYWSKQIISPVLYNDAICSLSEENRNIFIEIGPKPILINLTKQILSSNPDIKVFPSIQYQLDSDFTLIKTAQKLWAAGHPINWKKIYNVPKNQIRKLPGYPFEKKKYWWPKLNEQSKIKGQLWREHLNQKSSNHDRKGLNKIVESSGITRLGLPGDIHYYQVTLCKKTNLDLNDHCIKNQCVFPAAGFIEQTLNVLTKEGKKLNLKDLKLDLPLQIKGDEINLQIVYEPKKSLMEFFSSAEISKKWTQHGKVYVNSSETANLDTIKLGEKISKSQLEKLFESEPTEIPLPKYYGALRSVGLEYGNAYRNLVTIKSDGKKCIAEIRRVENSPDRAILDSCFQAIGALIYENIETNQLLLPVGFRSLEVYQWPLPNEIKVLTSIGEEENENTIESDLEIYANDSLILLIRGFQIRKVPKRLMQWIFPELKLNNPENQDCKINISTTGWKKLNLSAASQRGDDKVFIEANGIINLYHKIRSCNQEKVESVDLEVKKEEHYILELSPNELEARNLIESAEQLFTIIQAIAKKELIASKIMLYLNSQGPVQSALISMLKSATMEIPNCEFSVLITSGIKWQNFDKKNELNQYFLDHMYIKYESDHFYTTQQEKIDLNPYKFSVAQPGDLASLCMLRLVVDELEESEVEIEVEASGINFRDVLNALGMMKTYSASLGISEDAEIPLGGECVGRISRVGKKISEELIGQRVIGALAVGSLASHVITQANLCIPLPVDIEINDAAALSTAFLTAEHALCTLAKLQAGETILIHSGAGGVGQAAVQVARAIGAQIICTASRTKHQYLKEQGVFSVHDSRTKEFSQEILALTNGRGVDVVLNSLNSTWVDASFECLSQHGRFIEMGKIEVWSPEKAAEKRPDVKYYQFDLLEIASGNPQYINNLLFKILNEYKVGTYKPLPIKVFTKDQCSDAFRYIAQAKHIGKVVVNLKNSKESARKISSDGIYIITGGFGAIGTELIKWLISKGATAILVISKNAKTHLDQNNIIRWLESGTRISALNIDFEEEFDHSKIIEKITTNISQQKLLGMFHLSGKLEDGLITNQNITRLKSVFSVKWNGYIVLKKLQDAYSKLEYQSPFLVSFSSISALLGSPGQIFYSSVNSAIDGSCLEENLINKNDKLELSLQWGPWNTGKEGMVGKLDKPAQQRLENYGLRLLDPDNAFKQMELLLNHGRSGVFTIDNNDWNKVNRNTPKRLQNFISYLKESDNINDKIANPKRKALLHKLEFASKDKKILIIIHELQIQLARVMGLTSEDELDPSESLYNIGLDSLMVVELAAVLESEFGISLKFNAFANEPTIESLAIFILQNLEDGN